MAETSNRAADMETPDVSDVAMKIERAGEVYKAYSGVEAMPSTEEVWSWYLYELCTYFIHTTLIPVVFPLMISQIVQSPPEPIQGWTRSYMGLPCREKQMQLYEKVIHRSINVSNSKLSPLEWTSFSWALGLILSTPLLAFLSKYLDHGNSQLIIAGAATAIGSLFCLPVGFFKVKWIFPLYIIAIITANVITSASHTRHLGLILRGFTGPALPKNQFPNRRKFSSKVTLYATVAGCLGSALISTFTYHMLRESEKFLSLWVVSIFSGLKWLVGIFHIFFIRPDSIPSTQNSHNLFSIFAYPHAIGGLIGVFLSSFVTMCIFTGGALHLVGELCLKPNVFLCFWLTYYFFPLLSLPLLRPLQHVVKASSVKMKLLGFLLSLITSGFGFYYHKKAWERNHVLVFAAVQGTSVGILHAFGRVLVLDCTPPGKEGAFSAWYSWMRNIGTCAGFALASAIPGKVHLSFGIAFCAATVGMTVLVFGNVSDLGGAVKAGLAHGEAKKTLTPTHLV
ncbi:hypothetical protein HS088_TW18G00836 [Tripterygium wilfordii]|uniref:Major facilitator superfamily domain-containing protein n=1 Tax=Tripterygium wilfordii TaxID=458696 RepID=A0A7J7CEK4_TRIWF|nr:hypothetical protein HS088_TW18G00836 [Tripterygium wilfordii]